MKKEKINWREIFDGREHLLIEGVHYTRTFSFSKYIYQKAREYNIKVRQKVAVDNRSILVQLRQNELAEIKTGANKIVNAEVVAPSFVNSYDKYPFDEWFGKLVCGGQKEVEVNKLDEFGNPIPIMREFEGGFKAPTGKYETEKKIVRFEPKYVLELKYPQDFTCTPRKMAAIFCEAAKATNLEVLDVNKIHFDYRKKDRLIIRAGHIAEAYFSREETPDQYNLWINFNKNERIPLPRSKAEEWMDKLLHDGQLLLYKGRDYSGDGYDLAVLLRSNFPDIDFYPKEEVDNKGKDGTGWTTLLLTVRLPMLARMPKDMTLKQWEEAPEGKRLEQERDSLRLEFKNKNLLENIGYARLDYVKQMEMFTHDLNSTKDDIVKNIIKKKIQSLRQDFVGLIGEEEVKQLEQSADQKRIGSDSDE